MARCLYFDTETTGKWDFKAGIEAEHQPYIVQLAMILDDEAGRPVAEANLILELPDGVETEEGAFRVHGIGRDRIEAYGVSRKAALYLFDTFSKAADVLVAHNYDFDSKVIASAFHREGREFDLSKPSFCTMKNATNIVRIPGRYNNNYKWPTLMEAYQVLVDAKGFEGAHDAMADVRACREIHKALQARVA